MDKKSVVKISEEYEEIQFINDINSKLHEADIEAKISTKRFTHKEVFEKIKKNNLEILEKLPKNDLGQSEGTFSRQEIYENER